MPYGNPPYHYDAFVANPTLDGWDTGVYSGAWSVTTPAELALIGGSEAALTNGDAATHIGEDADSNDDFGHTLMVDGGFGSGVEILTRCQTTVNSQAGGDSRFFLGSVINRQGQPPGASGGYIGGLFWDAVAPEQQRRLGIAYDATEALPGPLEFLHSIIFNWHANTWYWIRFQRVGATFNLRAWEDGQPEPTTWQSSANHGGIWQGNFGVVSADDQPGGMQLWDFISINYLDGEAPAYLGLQEAQIPSAEEFFAVGSQELPVISPLRLEPTGGIFTPSIAIPYGPADFIESSEEFFEHAIHDDSDVLLAPFMPSTAQVFQPTAAIHREAAFIDDGEVYAPRVKRDWRKPPHKSPRDDPKHWQHEPLTNLPPRNPG